MMSCELRFEIEKEAGESGSRCGTSGSLSPLVFLRSRTETGRGRVAKERSGVGGACPQAQAQREAHGTQLKASNHRDLPLEEGK